MQPVQRICDFVEVDTPDLAGDPRFFPEVHHKKHLPPPPGVWVCKEFGFDYYYYYYYYQVNPLAGVETK